MEKSTIGKPYTSKTIVKILKRYIAEDQKKIERRAAIAAKISETLLLKAWTYKDLAARLGKRPSEVRKWLTGKHHFTSDLTSRIQEALGTDLES